MKLLYLLEKLHISVLVRIQSYQISLFSFYHFFVVMQMSWQPKQYGGQHERSWT